MDKGLGPCAITWDQYIQDCLIHLNDCSIFERLTPVDAQAATNTLEESIHDWIDKHKWSLDKMDI